MMSYSRATILVICLLTSCVSLHAQNERDNTILVRGNPSLTVAMVEDALELLEWSLGSSFSPENQQKIQNVIVRAWQADNRAQIRSVLDVVDVQGRIALMNDDDRSKIRQSLRDLILQNLGKEPKDELSVTVLGAYEASQSNVLIPSSAPLLTRIGAPTSRGNWHGGEFGLWTYSDRDRTTDDPRTEWLKAIYPSAIGRSAVPSGSMSFEAAIFITRRFLKERASPEAIAAFSASPQAGNARDAALAGGGALIANKPLAALAALLRAHELEPGNPVHLSNLAALLSYIGLYSEAIAILDSPSVRNGQPLLESGRLAASLNARGYSLLQLGRAAEAEAALRQAVQRAPRLVEASTNLAYALLMQDDAEKKTEGARLIAAVWRRNLPGNVKKATPSDPPKKPETSESEKIDEEIFETEKRFAANLDYSRGKRLKLPDLKIPGNIEASVAMHPKYTALQQEAAARSASLIARKEQLRSEREARLQKDVLKAANSGDPAAVMAVSARQEKFDNFLALIGPEKVQQHPAVKPAWDKASRARLNLTPAVPLSKQFAASEGREGLHIGPARDGEDKTITQHRQRRCSTTRQAHGTWRSGVHDYDIAHRNYLEAAYRHMTAVIANIADPVDHEIAQLKMEQYIYFVWSSEHIAAADSMFPAADAAVRFYCGSEQSVKEGEEIGKVEAEKAERGCPDFLKGANKAKLNLKSVSLSFNCESIGIEVSAPWMGLFVEGEANFKDGRISKYQGVTVGVGVKGELPGVVTGVEGKAGAYVKIDSTGKITDAGFKAGVTGTVRVPGGGEHIFGGVESGLDVQVTILPALGFDPPAN